MDKDALQKRINRKAMIVIVSGGSPNSRLELSDAIDELCRQDPGAASEFTEIKAEANRWTEEQARRREEANKLARERSTSAS
jgi:hypothetical protein